MKTKITLVMVCLMATVFSNAQTDTVNIFYPGYTNQCCAANSTPYFCFNDGATSGNCGNAASSSASTFTNTVPAGNMVTQVEVIYHAWTCGGTATPTLNGMALATTSMTAGSCLCTSSFVSTVSGASSNVYPCGIPGYNYGVGATETFNVSFVGTVCISEARIVLTYTNAASVPTPPTVTIAVSNDSICSGTTTTLTASGANTYTWSSNAGSAITNTVSLSPTNNSTYTVLGTDNANGCISMASQDIYVKNCVGGIKQIAGNNNRQVNIYPNPNNGSFIIETNSVTKLTMQIYDVTGKLVLSQNINSKATIDAGDLSEGVYNISIGSNEGMVNKRLVIVK